MTDRPITQLVVLGVLVVVTVVLGAVWRSRQGRVRPAPARRDLAVDWAARGVRLGERVTFVQLSAEVCAPCRATARVLRGLAEREDGVVHHELDVEEHLDLVRELGVLKTPTVLVLDAAGAQAARSSGGMSPAQARHALEAALPVPAGAA
ncbi:thioredoxin family protein [Isoptericola sp. NPDC057653]|uniref:thioredoxin family protein n=1 Tax=unclassified Isoptericola TaxID=2623355 RepID=UPI0036A7E7D8